MKNLAFHGLLRWKMIMLPILTTALIHFPFKWLGECSFWVWEERNSVKKSYAYVYVASEDRRSVGKRCLISSCFCFNVLVVMSLVRTSLTDRTQDWYPLFWCSYANRTHLPSTRGLLLPGLRSFTALPYAAWPLRKNTWKTREDLL